MESYYGIRGQFDPQWGRIAGANPAECEELDSY